MRAAWPWTVPSGWRFAAPRAPVSGRYTMVASDHPLASAVGVEVLRRGGNAIDAAVAVACALAVVHPQAGNLGGGGFLVYRAADGQVYSLDYRETAPAAATRDMYLDQSGTLTDQSLTGALASGVPGAVAGLAEMHRRFGRLPWRDVVEPAIALARDGHVVDAHRRRRRSPATRSGCAASRPAVATFLAGGAPPAAGDTLRQPDLARTLRAHRRRRRAAASIAARRRRADRGGDAGAAAASSRARTWPATSPTGASRSRPPTAAGASSRCRPPRAAA